MARMHRSHNLICEFFFAWNLILIIQFFSLSLFQQWIFYKQNCFNGFLMIFPIYTLFSVTRVLANWKVLEVLATINLVWVIEYTIAAINQRKVHVFFTILLTHVHIGFFFINHFNFTFYGSNENFISWR